MTCFIFCFVIQQPVKKYKNIGMILHLNKRRGLCIEKNCFVSGNLSHIEIFALMLKLHGEVSLKNDIVISESRRQKGEK